MTYKVVVNYVVVVNSVTAAEKRAYEATIEACTDAPAAVSEVVDRLTAETIGVIVSMVITCSLAA